MSLPFPHHYQISLTWSHEGSEGVLSGNSKGPILAGPPPQFDGKLENWSPEDLFTSSVALCLMTTFFALAKRNDLIVDRYACAAEGTLDKTSQGILFSGVTLKVDLSVSLPEIEKAKSVLEKAKKYCIVSNSIKCPVTVEANVNSK